MTLDRIIADFSTWFAAFQDTPDMESNGTESSPDLFTLLREMTALKEENRRQNRLLWDVLEEVKAQRAQNEQLSSDSGGSLCGKFLIDLCERLRVNIEALQVLKGRKTLLPWKKKRQAGIDQYRQGLQMTLDFVLEELKKYDIEMISVEDKPFDPEIMCAIAVERVKGMDGKVIRVAHNAYCKGDQIVRIAEVVIGQMEENNGKRK